MNMYNSQRQLVEHESIFIDDITDLTNSYFTSNIHTLLI